MMRRGLLVIVATALILVGCSSDGSESGTPALTVERAYIPPPAGANGALYFEVANEGDGPDHLIGARTSVADEAEMHRTTTADDGLTRMEPVEDLEIPAGETVTFEAGGLHIMLNRVDELEEGDVVEVELEFAESGTILIDAEVGSLDNQR
jgi:copper(I)-binding protein